MTCEQVTKWLDAYLDGELESGPSAAFEHHVATCESCDNTLKAARALQRALVDYPIAGPSDGFFERALNAASTAPSQRSSGPPRWVAAGFLGAFAASIATVVLTGLLVRAPKPEPNAALPGVSIAMSESHTVNLVFASADVRDVGSLTVDLPEGVQLSGYEDRRQVQWNTRLQAGKNVLPLELVAVDCRGGHWGSRWRHSDKVKICTVNVTIIPG